MADGSALGALRLMAASAQRSLPDERS